ncbi:MAG: copper resistance protein NlpE [Tannerellaceae bacterium]|jgi:uncharacterized lipoprotein NlpE involved in copper resistance|nr:copper resistance protein NlpE [Tannerellaceae bacterium]
MKKIIFLLSATSFLLAFQSCKSKPKTEQSEDTTVEITHMADNSQNSIEWEGVYTGVIPCADCEGIETSITLNTDLTYKMSMTYIGKDGAPEVFEGSFQWDDEGSNITLGGIREGVMPTKYKVGEYRLFQLDMEGNMIAGELADKYVLTKVME